MSGLDSVLTRIGAIERMVSGVHAPAAVGNAGAATSFADALDQAQLMDAAGVSATGSSATVGAVTSTAASPTSVATTAATSTSVTSTSAVPPAATRTAVTPAAATARPQSTPSTAVSGSRTPLAGKPAYRPAHVTETDERVWNDCTWASAAMWIDKLTGGAVKVDREALRAASGDRTGGSSLGDVVRGAKKLLGLDLRAAHDEHLTVDGLLDRLASGGGAIVQGSYASLPSSLTRNDPGFAAKGVAASGHAVYVGPLDRATGKVWWDDPLTPAGGSGQWISVRDLRTFLWKDSHGHVSALATPAGSSAPTAAGTSAGTHTGTASASASATAAAASISAAARTTGVDPLLLTAYLEVTHTSSDARAIDGAADGLAAALARYGRADLALESLGAAQSGSTRLAEGAVFAGDVLRLWAERLGRPTGG